MFTVKLDAICKVRYNTDIQEDKGVAMDEQEFLKTVSSTEMVRDWGELTLAAVKAQQPLLINHMRRPYLVLLPYDAYMELVEKARRGESAQ